MGLPVPPYFDFLIDAFQQCPTTRFVHLGHWDTPKHLEIQGPSNDLEFERAQQRLNDVLLDLAKLMNGQAVLDVGCGFGGTLQSIQDRFRNMTLVGVNIDDRQLSICQELNAEQDNDLWWLEADACNLPFSEQVFDRVLCIEAMFHFSSRQQFFLQASRVLKPGGLLVLSDIVLLPSARNSVLPQHHLESWMQQAFGPWPDLWAIGSDHAGLGSAAGLQCEFVMDATSHTCPSHRFTVPEGVEVPSYEVKNAMEGGVILKWLHDNGHLQYLYMCFRKLVP